MFTFLEQTKQVKMQWVQDPNHSNVDKLKNVRRKAGRHFMKEKKKYLKTKIN